MTPKIDPFFQHAELRAHVADPMSSFFRTFDIKLLAEKAQKLGIPQWWYSDEDRERMRRSFMESHSEGDLWIFAYGSLMWDPALLFDEVRRSTIHGYSRRFILKDIYGARGTAESPGLMAALDTGASCDGLVFRIPKNLVEQETQVLWRREQVGPAYKPIFINVATPQGIVKALTFVADHSAKLIDGNLTRDEQIRFLARGSGFAGSSMDYIRNIQNHFIALGINDEEVSGLLRDAEAYIATN